MLQAGALAAGEEEVVEAAVEMQEEEWERGQTSPLSPGIVEVMQDRVDEAVEKLEEGSLEGMLHAASRRHFDPVLVVGDCLEASGAVDECVVLVDDPVEEEMVESRLRSHLRLHKQA